MVRRILAAVAVAVVLVGAWAGLTWWLGGPGSVPDGAVVAVWTQPGDAGAPAAPEGVAQRLVAAGRLAPDGTPTEAPPSAPEGVGRAVGVLRPATPGRLRLGESAVRRRVVAAARRVLDAGYGGIHLEVTPWLDEDDAVLRLLSRLAELTRSRDALLSASVPAVEPAPGLAFLSQLVAADDGTWQSARSYRRLAQRADQLVVRMPAGWSPVPWLEGSLVRHTVSRAATAVASMRVTMLVDLRADDRDAGARGLLLRAVGQAVDGDVARSGRIGVAVPAAWLDPAAGTRLLEGGGS